MYQPIREKAAGLISGRKLRLLDDAGIALVPAPFAERLRRCSRDEEILGIEGGKYIVIREATAADIDRINSGYVVMD